MKKPGALTLTAMLGLSLVPLHAAADPIIGSIGFGNEVTSIPSGSPIGLNFRAAVTAGQYSFAPVPLGTTTSFADFTFSPSGEPISPLWAFTSGGVTYSFDLESIGIEDFMSGFLLVSGTGTLKMTGKDDTHGSWRFSSREGAGSLFMFSSHLEGPPGRDDGEGAVAEPASLLLLGMGLTGVASRLARRGRRPSRTPGSSSTPVDTGRGRDATRS